MAVAWCILYLLVMLLVGCAGTSTVIGLAGNPANRRSVPELAGLSLGLGVGLTGTFLFWLSLLGLAPGRLVLTILALGSIGALAAIWRLKRLPMSAIPAPDLPHWKNLAAAIPILLLFGANLVAGITAVHFPFFEWDGIVIWAFKANVMYHEALLWPRPDYFTDVTLSFSHLDYPLLFPALIAGAYGAMNEINEALGKIALPMIFAAHTLLAYTAARIWLDRFGALVVAVLLICANMSVTTAGTGNADTALAMFYLGSILYLLRWARDGTRADIVLSGLFSAFMATTKSEGLPLAGINALVLLGVCAMRSLKDRRQWIDFGLFAAILALGAGVWLLFRIGIPRTNDDYAGQVSFSVLSHNLSRIPTIIHGFFFGFTDFKTCGFVWIVLLVVALPGMRAFAWRLSRILWLLLVLHLLLYGTAYLFSPWPDVWALVKVTMHRLLLHALPAGMMLIAAHWSAIRIDSEVGPQT